MGGATVGVAGSSFGGAREDAGGGEESRSTTEVDGPGTGADADAKAKAGAILVGVRGGSWSDLGLFLERFVRLRGGKAVVGLDGGCEM